MALNNRARELFALGGERDAPVFFVSQQALGCQALRHRGDARLCDVERGGDVHGAGEALTLDQLQDALEVVLACDGGLRRAGLGAFCGLGCIRSWLGGAGHGAEHGGRK